MVTLAMLLALPADDAAERPIVGAVYFYWYEWDPVTETGSWPGGIYNTPLEGYYSSARYGDNLRSLQRGADWGVTDFFMDFWGRGWLGEDGQARERLLVRAAEELRARGYRIHMSMYQDGEDFDVKDLAANAEPGRQLRWWLEELAAGSDAWTRYRGRPVGLIYARNGTPVPSEDVGAYRRFLERRYGDVASLNRAWGTTLASWADVGLEGRPGQAWADLGDFRRAEWQTQWEDLQTRLRAEVGVPGIELSFDTGYAPYPWAGIDGFVQVFGGPHTYAGPYTPEQQLAERHLYHAAGRNHGRLSFDHHKGYYHDWSIRIPGISWWPEPYRLDRSFVGLLANRAQATLHMSWNEWWEGSNLEPSEEFGKGPCETNLLYSTLMQEAFASLARPEEGARVALLANEWPLRRAHPGWDDTLRTLTLVRRWGIPFATITGSPLDADLEPYDVIIAPTGGVGFERDPEVAERLLSLAGEGKVVVTSRWPGMRDRLGIPINDRPASADGKTAFNAFFDVGTEADAACLVQGFSVAEVWPHLMSFDGRPATVRWTPAVGDVLVLDLPTTPGRDHLLRWAGAALWPHTVAVVVNGRDVATVEVSAGAGRYEAPIGSDVIGYGARATVALVYRPPLVPKLFDPSTYPTEDRACNVALDWVQISTPEVPALTQEPLGVPQGLRVRSVAHALHALPSWRDEGDWRDPLRDHATVFSRYEADGIPRDIRVPWGEGAVVYVNGSIAGSEEEPYVRGWLPAVTGLTSEPRVHGPDTVGVVLSMGDSRVIAVLNDGAPMEPREIEALVAVPEATGAAARVLRRDGAKDAPIGLTQWGSQLRLVDTIRAFGLYEVCPGPLLIEPEALELVPGAIRPWRIKLRNPMDRPVRADISLRAVIPTLSAEPTRVTVPARSEVTVELIVRAREDIDWGIKTMVLRVLTDSTDARTVRAVTVRPLPEIVCCASDSPVEPGGVVRLMVVGNRHLVPAPAEEVTVTVGGRVTSVDVLRPGESLTATVGALEAIPVANPGIGAVAWVTGTVRYRCMGVSRESTFRVPMVVEPEAATPPGALWKIVAYDPGGPGVAPVHLAIDLSGVRVDHHRVTLRDAGAAVVPHVWDGDTLHALTAIPEGGGRCLYLCEGEDVAEPCDLRLATDGLGTGSGCLTVSNGVYSITWEEGAGGCVTHLISDTTGCDYGAGTFGAGAGRYQLEPKLGTTYGDGSHVVDEMIWQRDGPGSLRIVAGGDGDPVVIVEARSRGPLQATQRYVLVAGQPWFIVESTATAPEGPPEELVLLDFRLRRGGLTKITPNWVGIPAEFGQERPHFGWRESVHVPDTMTMLERPDPSNREAWTLALLQGDELTHIRQGFWPSRRMRAGRCRYAEVELVARPAPSCATVRAAVILHSGHHVAGREVLARLRTPPLVAVSPVRE